MPIVKHFIEWKESKVWKDSSFWPISRNAYFLAYKQERQTLFLFSILQVQGWKRWEALHKKEETCSQNDCQCWCFSWCPSWPNTAKKGDCKVKKPKEKPHCSQNSVLFRETGRYYVFQKRLLQKAIFSCKVQVWKENKKKKILATVIKPVGGNENGGAQMVKLKTMLRHYPTEDLLWKLPSHGKSPWVSMRGLHDSITPGATLIMLTWCHRAMTVDFLK